MPNGPDQLSPNKLQWSSLSERHLAMPFQTLIPVLFSNIMIFFNMIAVLWSLRRCVLVISDFIWSLYCFLRQYFPNCTFQLVLAVEPFEAAHMAHCSSAWKPYEWASSEFSKFYSESSINHALANIRLIQCSSAKYYPVDRIRRNLILKSNLNSSLLIPIALSVVRSVTKFQFSLRKWTKINAPPTKRLSLSYQNQSFASTRERPFTWSAGLLLRSLKNEQKWPKKGHHIWLDDSVWLK